MTYKFQKGDEVLRRENSDEGIIWKKAGTISGTLNKATDNGQPIYSVRGYDEKLRSFHENQLESTSYVNAQAIPEFKPGVMA